MIGVLAGVQLDRFCSQLRRLRDCFGSRIDEEARANSRASQKRDRSSRHGAASRNTSSPPSVVISSRFSGTSVDLLRLDAQRDADHFIGARCLEIEVGRDRSCKCVYVGVLYVSSVFAEMRGYSISTGELAHGGCLYRARLNSAPSLSQRRDMVDVYVESLMSCWHYHRRLGSHQLSWSTT